jgi:hypothetical protein
LICGRGLLAFLVVSQPVARRPEAGVGGARQGAGPPKADKLEEEGVGVSAATSETASGLSEPSTV